MPEPVLGGRVALVTGGARGIGLATARWLADAGARVAIVDIDEDAARVAAAEVEGIALVADVADATACAGAVAQVASELGRLDILCNNAGIGAARSLHEYSERAWRSILDVNLTGTFHGIRAAAPLMLAAGGGTIVNVASVSGVRPTRYEAPYSAAKAGVISLTMAAAIEYAPTVRVNCVSPGMIDTALTAPALDAPAVRAAVEAATPLRRVGTADEVAQVIGFLASPHASYVTGQNVVVDGGSALPNSQADALLEAFVLGADPA